MKIVEVKGVPHALTQSDGETFRIYAHQTKVIADDLISEEFLAEEKREMLLILPDDVEVIKPKIKIKED